MARNRRDIEPKIKREALVEAAAALFLKQGYEASSMSALAAAAGVAPNTLYWYFEDKDALLIAALDLLVGRAAAAYAQAAGQSSEQRWGWVLDQFEQARGLVGTVHARLAHSPHVKAWHDRFHRLFEQLLSAEFIVAGMSPTQARDAALIATYVAEGLLSHPHEPAQRATALAWLSKLPQLVKADAPPRAP